MTVAKIAAFGLRMLGRNASYMPGVIALKIAPDFMKYLKKPELLICVTGTNGKTTTSNFITSALRSAGYTVTNNSFGSNVQAGVAAAMLLNSTLSGRHKNRAAVIEVDERSSLKVYPYISPDYIVCNNVMRDSIKRNAHTQFISFILTKAIPESAALILNADDIISCGIAPQCKNRIYFGVDAERPEREEGVKAKDIVYCPHCGGLLEKEYIRYSHIGRVRCSQCGFASPERDFCVTDIDRENETFTVTSEKGSEQFKLVNDNIVNVYNFCGCIALLETIGLKYDDISAAFNSGEIVKTRFIKEKLGDKAELTMILAKGQNPVAVSRVFSYVSKTPGENKCLLLFIDDKADNINNVENTCWLYDLDYEPLKDPSIGKMIFAGKRCLDQRLRCEMTGISPEKTVFVPELKNSSELIDLDKYGDIYILYDNYLMDEAYREEKALKGRCSK
ncbi:MAG: DUF1727 domain-containing protein [Clostridia bacterium]|nr:DUF1727 domain-containing protein [Clostridia bacterium]